MIPIAELTNPLELGTADMKSFKQFLSESITINGDFNGTLNVGGSSEPEKFKESFAADVVWQGSIYRIEMTTENGLPTRNQLAEHLQDEYPGLIVQNIYPLKESDKPIQVTNSKRYHPAKLDWI